MVPVMENRLFVTHAPLLPLCVDNHLLIVFFCAKYHQKLRRENERMNPNQGIYDARQLGRPKMLILGVQHMFAMFGATVLVPALTGLSVSATLLFAGLGTLLFHFLTKGMVPAFLGSSFAFIGGYQAIAPMLTDSNGNAVANTEMLPYACFWRHAGRIDVCPAFRPVPHLWHQKGHALLPSHRHRPHHHLYRPDPQLHRHLQLPNQLGHRPHRHRHCGGLQHLGQGNDQKSSPSCWAWWVPTQWPPSARSTGCRSWTRSRSRR